MGPLAYAAEYLPEDEPLLAARANAADLGGTEPVLPAVGATLRFLAAHDTDPFVRWDSGQQVAATVLLDMVAAIQQGHRPDVDPALIEAMASLLDQEPAFAAEALALPGVCPKT